MFKHPVVAVGFPIVAVAAVGWWIFGSPTHNLLLPAEDYNLHYDQVPSYFHEAFILTGYRKPALTALECLQSLFCLHNESVNIWTHLLAALWFWKQAIFCYCHSHICSNNHVERNVTNEHKSASNKVLSQYCASQATVFTASFIAHTFSPTATNEEEYHRLWRLDWSMIAVAMLGVSWILVHLAFHGYPKRQVFWKRAFLISTATMFFVVNVPFFTRMPPRWKALGALFPIPTLLYFAWETTQLSPRKGIRPTFLKEVLLKPLLLAGLGLAVYAAQVPERIFPGMFDLSGGSHTVHHLWTFAFSFWMLRNADHFQHQWSPKDDSEEFLLPTSQSARIL